MRTVIALLFGSALAIAQPPSQAIAKRTSEPSPHQADSQSPASPVTLPPTASERASYASPAVTEKDTGQNPGSLRTSWERYLKDAFSASYLSNWVLALFAAVAAVIALKTLSAIKEQARVARITLDATRSAAGAARRSAIAASDGVAQAVESNRITRDATELTRQSFLLAHRPRLIVRSLVPSADFGVDRVPEGTLRIVNEGGTAARIDRVFVTAKLYGFLPTKPIYQDMAGSHVGHSLAPGEALVYPYRKDDGAMQQPEILALDRKDGARRDFYVLGFIVYTDELLPPITRQTFFCRQFSRDRMRFEPVDNQDYEHAD